jgi:CRISPR-associated protein Cmr1
MRELRVRLETVTPLFLAGAEPRGEPELRPPAFRGAMRYWLRALLGGSYGDDADCLKKLHDAESSVFGSSNEELGGASGVTIRISYKDQPKPLSYTKQRTITVTKGGKSRQQPTGKDYLYWSMAGMGSQSPKQFYPPGTKFDLVLNSISCKQNSADALRLATASLWLLLNFGGIGSRAHRLGGSLSVYNSFREEGLNFYLAAKTAEEASQQLKIGLDMVRKLVDAKNSAKISGRPDFDVLHPKTCQIWVLDMWNSPEQAVEAIGGALRDFRTYTEPDHSNVAKWLNGQPINTVERAAFGLPLPYRYSNGLSGTIQGKINPPSIERRASPLWLKISKTGANNYIGVATLFDSNFLPRGEKLYAKTRQGAAPPINPPQNYDIIRKWIQGSFKSKQVNYD